MPQEPLSHPSQVHLERSTDKEELKAATHRTLEATGFDDVARTANRIVIKPNLVTADGPDEGITSDVALTEALLERLASLRNALENTIIAEGRAGDTQEAFRRNGYDELANRFDVELVDCNTAPSVKLEVPDHISVRRLRVNRAVAEADLRISVAKLKIHSVGLVTGVLKNMMGVLPGRKWKLVVHANVHKRVVDLNSLVRPHFGLIDGYIGNQVDEVISNPVQTGLVLGGQDSVALDSVAAIVMGVDPGSVPYLCRCAERGWGEVDLERIEVTGVGIEDISQRFKRATGLGTWMRVNSQKAYGYILGTLGSK